MIYPKIYFASKSATLFVLVKEDKWILEFDSKDTTTNPLMGWESSNDTMGEIKLEFSTKDKAIEYAKNNNISYKVIEPNKRKFIIKSYAENFTKN